MCEELPSQVKYWLTASTKHDCFFLVGPEEGPTERIGAFKVLLAGHSEPFRNMLEESDISEQGDVRIIDVEPKTFKLFLKCVYGSADCNSLVESLSFEECINLLYVVDKYLVNTIKPKVISHMLQLLHFEIISKKCEGIFLALSSRICLNNEQLRAVILHFVEYNTEQIFSDDRFLQLTDESLLEILKLDVLNINEMNIWNGLCRWAEYNVNSSDGKMLRKQMLQHLKYIRFSTLDLNSFCTNVVPKDILTPEEVYEVIKSFKEDYKSSEIMKHIRIISKLRRLPTESKTNTSEAVFFHMETNIKQLSRSRSSTFQYQNLSWHIMIRKRNGTFDFFLVCSTEVRNGNWSCFVNGELVLVNQCGKPNRSGNISHLFNSEEYDWGFNDFYPWDKLLNPINGFVKDGRIIIMACLKT